MIEIMVLGFVIVCILVAIAVGFLLFNGKDEDEIEVIDD